LIPIYKQWCILIDITNYCNMSCSYCTRYIRHLRNDQKKHMSLEDICTALDTFVGWPSRIGIIGGEPLMHPQIEAICSEVQKRFPKEKCCIWTAGANGGLRRLMPILEKTFGKIEYNPHAEEQLDTCKHQPITLAIDEALPDALNREKMIDNCWVQRFWCASINHYGAYFCEVAGALDSLLNNGASAWKVEPGWWNKVPRNFGVQKELCLKCGMCVPTNRIPLRDTRQQFTPKLLEEFKAKGLEGIDNNEVIITEELNLDELRSSWATWYPSNYREDLIADKDSEFGLGLPEDLDYYMLPSPPTLHIKCPDAEKKV